MDTITVVPVVFTPDELKLHFEQLSQSDWSKLGKAAHYLTWGLSISGDDLLNEMFCRALQGKRKCRIDLPIVVFLIGAMKSEVSSILEKRKHDVLAQAVHEQDCETDHFEEYPSMQNQFNTPEQILIADQALNRLVSLFQDVEVEQMILMGQEDELSPKDIQELCGITPTQYASALKSIRRKRDKFLAQE